MVVHILHDLQCVTSSALLCQTGPTFLRSQSLPKQLPYLVGQACEHVGDISHSNHKWIFLSKVSGSEGGTEKGRALHQCKWSHHLALPALLVSVVAGDALWIFLQATVGLSKCRQLDMLSEAESFINSNYTSDTLQELSRDTV